MSGFDDEPIIVHSTKEQSVAVDGYRFDICIYRAEGDAEWLLEVVDHEGTSHVWDETFKSDKDARNTALNELEKEGAIAFMHGDDGTGGGNVVPFKPR